ncbi:hypothetical protein VTI74DRAFT_3919 [Chaetomium olivicolor]
MRTGGQTSGYTRLRRQSVEGQYWIAHDAHVSRPWERVKMQRRTSWTTSAAVRLGCVSSADVVGMSLVAARRHPLGGTASVLDPCCLSCCLR